MKCSEVQDWLAAYWDLPEGDEQRLAIEEHIRVCPSCGEEFEIWRESEQLIRETVDSLERPVVYEPVRGQVMKRIYERESWRVPVTDRIYSISYTMRRNITAMIAFCMALFLSGLLLSIFHDGWGRDSFATDSNPVYGLKPVASASADANSATVKSRHLSVSVATASIKEPYMIQMGPLRSYPDYMIVLSLLGLTSTLLIMNWLSRTKA